MNEDEFDASLYETTMKFLNNRGFNQYEVSNFCKVGFECEHNLIYWQHKNYISFGPSAHSFLENKRWWNFSGVKQYIGKVEKNGNAVCGEEVLSNEELLDEFVMLALRSKGLDLNELENIHGNYWLIRNRDYLNDLIANKLIIEEKNFIKFTSNGYLFCDEILQKFK